VFFIVLGSIQANAQNKLTGSITEKKTNNIVFDVQVSILNATDTSLVQTTRSDTLGKFSFNNIPNGTYLIRLNSFEHKELIHVLEVTGSTHDLNFSLARDAELIDEVTVQAKGVRVELKDDTTQYNANAYKVNADATIEDLIKKMPGITVENGTVKAQGEQIKKVLIDGEEFFGDDAISALKNLPADMVNRIQVFDHASEQSRFTGISDGKEQKALNIQTKPSKNQGQFGKIYGGYGYPNDLYQAGINLNFFNGKRKISILGLSNNINQQNFSSNDIVGVTGVTETRGPRRDNSNDNFLVSQQNGISTTHAIGINYSDKWGEKTKFTGSYFFNYASTDNSQSTERNYFLSSSTNQNYAEKFSSLSKNMNHRLNLKFDIKLDSMNSLQITPKISIQNNNKNQQTSGVTTLSNHQLINDLANSLLNVNNGVNASNSIVWKHKFKKPRRTFSTNLSSSYNNRYGHKEQDAHTNYYIMSTVDSVSTLNQLMNNNGNGHGVDLRLSYTEPIGKYWSTEFVYNPVYLMNNANRKNYNLYDTLGSVFDSTLSNVFVNQTIDNEAGTNLQYKNEKVSLQVGVSYKNSMLLNDQEFPTSRKAQVVFHNLLPNLRFKYQFSKSKSFMLFYRASTNNPSIDQLQEVVDNSNPLSLSAGNPALKQQYDHRIFARYFAVNTKHASNFFIYVSANVSSNYITTASFIAQSDTVVANNISLAKGSQFRQPVNINGLWKTSTYASYGFALPALKLNINANAGGGYGVTPGLINQRVNQSKTSNINAGIKISSDINENIDFLVSYAFNFNNSVNSTQNNINNRYYIHNLSAQMNWTIAKRFLVYSTFNASANEGLSSGFNQTYMLWTGGLGYKFLKDYSLVLRVNVFDILNNNKSIVRTVSETYIEDVQSNVLNRYLMGTLTYTLKSFGSKKVKSGAAKVE
jgi:hypothetical protein